MAIVRTVYVRATAPQVVHLLSSLSSLSARGNLYESRQLRVRIGLALLSKVKQAFVTKARGGTDETGLRWQSLSPLTIAYRRRHPGLPSKRPRDRYFPSYALKAPQKAKWWRYYRRALAWYKGDKAHAAAHAWFMMRKEGWLTLFDLYSGTSVEILRDTGLLLNSLSPGVAVGAAPPPGSPPAQTDQVFRVPPGEVIIGTNRKWARTHHHGVAGHIPRRPLWPDPGRWTRSWWAAILEQAQLGVMDLAIFLLRGAP